MEKNINIFDKRITEPSTKIEEFEILIELIKSGNTVYEPEARRLVNKYGFSKKSLEDALKKGAMTEYFRTVNLIKKEGLICFEPIARELASKYDFSTKLLENALMDLSFYKEETNYSSYKSSEPKPLDFEENKYNLLKETLEDAFGISYNDERFNDIF